MMYSLFKIQKGKKKHHVVVLQQLHGDNKTVIASGQEIFQHINHCTTATCLLSIFQGTFKEFLDFLGAGKGRAKLDVPPRFQNFVLS